MTYIEKNVCKGHSFNNFFGHSLTSEVKGHVYKVVNNYVKCMCKKFRKSIINYSWSRSFKSYDFILNEFMSKNFNKGHTFNNFFGHSMTSEVKGHFYKVVDNYVTCMSKNFRKNIMNYSWYRSFKSYDFILNDFIDKNFRKGHTLNNFFRTLNGLWGQRSLLQSCWQLCKMHV